MVKLVDLTKLHEPIQYDIEHAINRVISSGWFVGGEEVDAFEAAFRDYCGVQHCVGCANGTDALELMLRAMDVGPGDEVIVPALTWVSNAEAVLAVGAKPVFADVGSNYTIDLQSILHQLTKRTKVIMAVHLYGQPCEMDGIMNLAETHKLRVIEDCAQAHGAKYKGRRVGGLGHAAAFSFYPTKNLGAIGDAGCITTNDRDIAEKIRLLSDHGQRGRDVHVLSGRTSRLDPVQAAVLSVKLKYLDGWNEQRNLNAQFYFNALKGSDIILPRMDDNASHVFHQFVIRLNTRDELRNHLEKYGVQTAVHYPKPLNMMSFFPAKISCPTSESICSSVLSLPIHPNLTLEDLNSISSALERYN